MAMNSKIAQLMQMYAYRDTASSYRKHIKYFKQANKETLLACVLNIPA